MAISGLLLEWALRLLFEFYLSEKAGPRLKSCLVYEMLMFPCDIYCCYEPALPDGIQGPAKEDSRNLGTTLLPGPVSTSTFLVTDDAILKPLIITLIVPARRPPHSLSAQVAATTKMA